MRAYVITDTIEKDATSSVDVVGVTSSRKASIDICEDHLNNVEPGDSKITWKRKDKHFGHAIKGDHVVAYEMFFVNNLIEHG